MNSALDDSCDRDCESCGCEESPLPLGLLSDQRLTMGDKDDPPVELPPIKDPPPATPPTEVPFTPETTPGPPPHEIPTPKERPDPPPPEVGRLYRTWRPCR